MKTLLVALVAVTAAAPVLAEEATPVASAPTATTAAKAKTPLTPQMKQERFLKNTGGLIGKPGTKKGEIVYVNCQKRGTTASIKASVDSLKKEMRFNVTLKENGTFDFKKPKVEGDATLFIVDDENLPVLLAAPEDRWALVNYAPIAAEEKRPAFVEARFSKEIHRAAAYLCGAANSQYPMALTRGIKSRAELDQNPDLRLPADILQRMATFMAPLGVTQEHITTYRTACREGWAPQPTNDFQKAIWNKVHELPSDPIKIKYDPKRDK